MALQQLEDAARILQSLVLGGGLAVAELAAVGAVRLLALGFFDRAFAAGGRNIHAFVLP